MYSVLDSILCLMLSVSALYTLYTGISVYLKYVSSSDHATTTLSMFFYAKIWDCDFYYADEGDCVFKGDSSWQVFSYLYGQLSFEEK